MKKIILDLCGGTGNWSKPYKDAGYDVRLVTLPGDDVRDWFYRNRLNDIDRLPIEIYGVLASPTGIHFSEEKDADSRTLNDISLLTACLMIIAKTKPKFWAIESPVGRMKKLLGIPNLIFNPCDYGDSYTKKIYLWGVFKEPVKNPVEPVFIRDSEKRSITPRGFSEAFFKANP